MKRLKILNYSWHAGHQYELHKLPHDFFLVVRQGVPQWKFKHRPMHPGVNCLREEELPREGLDVAIFHFDERMLDQASSQEDYPFLYFNQTLKIPKIAICHGTPPLTPEGSVDPERKKALVETVGDTLVVVNSHQAQKAWGFKNSVTIWHGFDFNEYMLGSRKQGILTITNFDPGRECYQGYDFYRHCNQSLSLDILWSRGKKGFNTVSPGKGGYFLQNFLYNLFRKKIRDNHLELSKAWRKWILNPYARGRFQAYKKLIGQYQIYFNSTRWSPMPRARAEAMLMGLALVTTNFQDEERFIENEKNGFYSNDPDQLLDYLRFLLAHPDQALKVGSRGRETASKRFGLDRFLDEWQRLLQKVTA